MRNVEIHHGRPKDVEALLAEYVNYAHKVLQWYCSGTAVVLALQMYPPPLFYYGSCSDTPQYSIATPRSQSISTPQSPRLNRHASIVTPR